MHTHLNRIWLLKKKHQHLLNVTRALLYQSHVPLPYWSDCVLTAVFLINRLPSPLLGYKSPFELLLGKKPDYSSLKTFGSLCYVSTFLKDRNKFSPRAKPCVFLGYPLGYKGFKVLDLESRSVSISQNVVFHESDFPFKTSVLVSTAADMFPNSILLLPVPFHFVETFPLPEHLHTNCSHPMSSSEPVPVVDTSHASSSHMHTNDGTSSLHDIFETGVSSGDVVRPRRSTKPLFIYLSIIVLCSLFHLLHLQIFLFTRKLLILFLLFYAMITSIPFFNPLFLLTLLKLNPKPLRKLWNLRCGEALSMRNLKQTELGILRVFLLARMLWVVSGCTR